MSDLPPVVVLHGGISSERDVSLASGRAIAAALGKQYEVKLIELNEAAIPEPILDGRSVVFPALHGTFGEDGQLQGLLEAAGIFYCGSDARSSRLCMDKAASKQLSMQVAVPTARAVYFEGGNAPLADDVIRELGNSLVIKPSDQGSSFGLRFAEHRSELGVSLSQIHSGNWMIEQRIRGREMTVGILNGSALGVVEIITAAGVYDYSAKYTVGMTEYVYPAPLDADLEARVKRYAERIFAAAGCRDFARVDFILDGSEFYFLEVNTLPGMTPTSLLPKSASCRGLDFDQLVAALVQPAVKRKANSLGGEEPS